MLNVLLGSLADLFAAYELRPLFYGKRTYGAGMSASREKADEIGDLRKSPLIARSGP